MLQEINAISIWGTAYLLMMLTALWVIVNQCLLDRSLIFSLILDQIRIETLKSTINIGQYYRVKDVETKYLIILPFHIFFQIPPQFLFHSNRGIFHVRSQPYSFEKCIFPSAPNLLFLGF